MPGIRSCSSLMAGKEQPIDNLAALAKAGVPVLHDCGALDPWLDSQTRVVEKRYKELGGKITVIVREGEGHFPLSPKDPKSVVDFIIKNARTGRAAPPNPAPRFRSKATPPYPCTEAARPRGTIASRSKPGTASVGRAADRLPGRFKSTGRETTRSALTTPRNPAPLDSTCRSAVVAAGSSTRWR